MAAALVTRMIETPEPPLKVPDFAMLHMVIGSGRAIGRDF